MLLYFYPMYVYGRVVCVMSLCATEHTDFCTLTKMLHDTTDDVSDDAV